MSIEICIGLYFQKDIGTASLFSDSLCNFSVDQSCILFDFEDENATVTIHSTFITLIYINL